MQGFERGCLVVGFGIFPSVDQGHHGIVVVLLFKQIAGDIVGAAAIHGKLHLQTVQKFVQLGGGVGKFHFAYCGRGFAFYHGKLIAGYTVRAFPHGAVLVIRHSDHAQMQRFALVFFQVDDQAGVLGSTRPCFGGLPVAAFVLVLCQQHVVVQCAVGDARPCDLIRQGFGVGVVGQQNAVGCAGLGQAGADVRILLGCRCAHGVGAACFGYAGNRKAHGGKVPIRRTVGELVHRHGQRGFCAVRFQGCRALGQVDLDLAVFGFAVQLVGVTGSILGVIPSKGIDQIVLAVQLAGCVLAQGRGGQNGEGNILGNGTVIFVDIIQSGHTVFRIGAVCFPHIFTTALVWVTLLLILPAAGSIAHTRIDGGSQNAPLGIIGQHIGGQVGKGDMGRRTGQNRFDRLQGDILVFQALSAWRLCVAIRTPALQHNAVLGVVRLTGNAQVCGNGQCIRRGSCQNRVCHGQFTQAGKIALGDIGLHVVLGRLHPLVARLFCFGGCAQGKRSFILITKLSDITFSVASGRLCCKMVFVVRN